ncbi:MAG: sarcosine oxidase subunit delta [SAR324 cluster bacterium]|jgi:sarcosine oxidase subunit delta|nr:sarcosine oxidase subunit delta [SAR324 cluster bacterium]MDP6521201.1 sarcosine oxidase subunit delta [SAR324 cluster bacterium]MDP7620368.1 sarcosine oxidase subunit delta [SAR324 cluster bacterium]|tara:strand:+ start:131 stop:424 length:294 start_codon:yes stop_codon:yes gene_type:complete
MSYQLNCPNCGKRAVSEFTFRSEYLKRPAPDADFSVWADYVYFRENNMGHQTEWWYHRSGCQSWFLAERDTTNNTDHRSFWYHELEKNSSNNKGDSK